MGEGGSCALHRCLRVCFRTRQLIAGRTAIATSIAVEGRFYTHYGGDSTQKIAGHRGGAIDAWSVVGIDTLMGTSGGAFQRHLDARLLTPLNDVRES